MCGGRRGLVGAAGVYAAMAIAWAAPSSLSPLDTVPDVGDPLHLAYVMAWDAHQLGRRPWALYDANSFHPYPRSLAFGDHLLPEALLVAPVNWATGNAVLASNAGVLLALWLSALAMFALVRSLTGSWGAGLLAGLVYAFNSFTQNELPRVHVLNLQWWPLALLFLARFVRHARRRDALLFAGALALQGLSGAYYLVCTALLAPLWLAAAYLAARRRPRRRELAALGAAIAAVALPCALLLWPYAVQLRAMGFEKALADGADAACYLVPPAGAWLWGGVRLYRECFGLPHFLGFLAALLMGAGAALVLRGRIPGAARGTGVLALATAALGLALSLGPVVRAAGRALGPGPFALLHAWIPLVRGMDGSKRAGVLVVLGGAILAGLAAARLLERLPRPSRAAALAVLAVALPLEHWRPPRPAAAVPVGAGVPSVYRWLAEESRGPLVELPLYPEVSRRYWSVYLYLSTYHWRPVPIGRTSFYPPAHDFLAWSLRGFPDEIALTLLERLGIRTIVVHPLGWEEPERERRLAALDACPRLRLLRRFDDPAPARFAELWLGGERVYRIEGRRAPEPPCTPVDELRRDAWRIASLGVPAAGAGPAGAHGFEAWVRRREWRTPWITEWARDGERRTAWITGDAQRPGDGLELSLGAPRRVAAVALDLAYPYDEFPREPVLAGEGAGPRRRLPFADGPEQRWETLAALLERPRQARLVLRLETPQDLSRLVVRLGGRLEDQSWPRWSVPELRLFGGCRPR